MEDSRIYPSLILTQQLRIAIIEEHTALISLFNSPLPLFPPFMHPFINLLFFKIRVLFINFSL